jgi:cytochrome c oxidase subunit 1
MTTAPYNPLSSKLHDWVTTVDHKKLGVMYIVSGLFYLIVAGCEALMMRWQLAIPDNSVLSPDTFNAFFTMHGTTMIFLVGMPILLGAANYFIPLMIGTRDMAFPRLNAFGFWLFFFGALLLYFSFLGGQGLSGEPGAPDVGWFAYAPLTSTTFSPGSATDYWIISLFVAGMGSIMTAVNLVTTILTMRCEGMTLMKMPIFAWMMLVDALLILIALPTLTAIQIMLLLDRQFGAHFFDAQAGADPMIWQHLFWFFGHPEVYILILPGFAFVSEVTPVFSRKVLFGYSLMVAATVSIGFIALGVWAHHMFATGLSPAVLSYFAGATFIIGVPTGMKIFNWIATMWGGHIRFETPMLFATGFISMFVIGGLTGIMLAIVPMDWQLSDTYFVVGHFHFVLFGGLLFAIFSGFFYWFPKVTGKLLNETMGKWQFWLLFVGFLLTFGPMHMSGFEGMPRRIYTYMPGRGLELWNMLASIGALVQVFGFSLFVINVIWSLRNGKLAGDDPWDAWTLEWSTTSPPPPWNYAELPSIRSRRPLWDEKHPEDPDWLYE